MKIALALGPIAFLVLLLVGSVVANSMDASGVFGPLMKSIMDIISRRCVVAGLGLWILCWLAAMAIYRKKRRLLLRL